MAVFNIGVTFGFAMMVLFQRSVAQTVLVVGDSIGWTVPQGGGAQAYITWASGKNFMVGDTLSKSMSSSLVSVSIMVILIFRDLMCCFVLSTIKL